MYNAIDPSAANFCCPDFWVTLSLSLFYSFPTKASLYSSPLCSLCMVFQPGRLFTSVSLYFGL